MAVTALQTESARSNSAIVGALLRALQMLRDAEVRGAGEADLQFAYAASEGAQKRTLECGIDTVDHVAATALMAFDEIESTLFGYAHDRDGVQVIDVVDARRELRIVQKALLNIWEYAGRNDPDVKVRLAPLAEHCQIDRFA